MTTLQEQIEKCFPDKKETQISFHIAKHLEKPQIQAFYETKRHTNFTNYDLDLREYVNLEYLLLNREKITSIKLPQSDKLEFLNLDSNQLTQIDLSYQRELKELILIKNNLTSVDLSGCKELRRLSLFNNNLTSVNFLNQLPNPEKLEELEIYDNNIQPTTLDFLRPFVNLKDCKLGENMGKSKIPELLNQRLKNKTYNKFYSSLEPIKNLTKLESFCIAGTDVEEGIEYIPSKIATLSKGKGERTMKLNLIDCQPLREDAKVKKIQDELRLFNYDIEAWQLAHPEKMLIARPEYFIQPDSREKWMTTLRTKIQSSKETLAHLAQNETDKLSKFVRLETQIKILEKVVELEREIHQDSMKAMDNFYQQNPPLESVRLKNILQQFEKNYLKISQENKQKEQEIKELKGTIEITEKILEKEYRPKETATQATQTDLTIQDYEWQQKENQELQSKLENQKAEINRLKESLEYEAKINKK